MVLSSGSARLQKKLLFRNLQFWQFSTIGKPYGEFDMTWASKKSANYVGPFVLIATIGLAMCSSLELSCVTDAMKKGTPVATQAHPVARLISRLYVIDLAIVRRNYEIQARIKFGSWPSGIGSFHTVLCDRHHPAM